MSNLDERNTNREDSDEVVEEAEKPKTVIDLTEDSDDDEEETGHTSSSTSSPPARPDSVPSSLLPNQHVPTVKIKQEPNIATYNNATNLETYNDPEAEEFLNKLENEEFMNDLRKKAEESKKQPAKYTWIQKRREYTKECFYRCE